MKNELLKIEELSVASEDKTILHNLNLEIHEGETHILMGPNGAGKSTLGYSIMGSPQYTVTDGKIYFAGEDITEAKVNQRAEKGIFLSFQAPIEVPGITLRQFLQTVYQKKHGRGSFREFRKQLDACKELLEIENTYIDRELNVGFSGGEKKKIEMLQLLLFEPKFAILDETDSGLDVDAMKIVSKGIKKYQEDKSHSLLIITHNTRILEQVAVDYTHVLVQGTVVKTADSNLIADINEHGFEQFLKEGV